MVEQRDEIVEMLAMNTANAINVTIAKLLLKPKVSRESKLYDVATLVAWQKLAMHATNTETLLDIQRLIERRFS